MLGMELESALGLVQPHVLEMELETALATTVLTKTARLHVADSKRLVGETHPLVCRLDGEKRSLACLGSRSPDSRLITPSESSGGLCTDAELSPRKSPCMTGSSSVARTTASRASNPAAVAAASTTSAPIMGADVVLLSTSRSDTASLSPSSLP